MKRKPQLNRKQLIAAIKTHYKGQRRDIYEMSLASLRAIERSINQELMIKLMRGDNEK